MENTYNMFDTNGIAFMHLRAAPYFRGQGTMRISKNKLYKQTSIKHSLATVIIYNYTQKESIISKIHLILMMDWTKSGIKFFQAIKNKNSFSYFVSES